MRWREFFAGVWARLTGSATGGPWPRISELDQEMGTDTAAASDGDSSSPLGETAAASNLPFRPVNPSTLPKIDAHLEKVADEAEHGKLEQPADVLTPPYTPATQSPTGASAPVRPDSPSSEIELPGSVLAEEEKHEAGSVGRRAKAANLLWPILEEEPTYRVDWGVNIFNYDCGLYVVTRFRASFLIPRADDLRPIARNIPTNPASCTKRLALRSTSCTGGIPTNSPSLDTPSAHTSPSRSVTRPRTRHGSVRPARDQVATSERSSTGEFFQAEAAPTPERSLIDIVTPFRPFNLPVPYRDHFARFSSILFSLFSGKPHWAKTHTLTPADLRKLYPRFDDFLAVRERVDPERVLANEYVKRHLLGEVPPAQMAQQGRRWKERA